MAADTDHIKRLLQRKRHLDVPGDWLEACVAWIHEENEGRSLSTSEVEGSVWEQWLVCDLRELSHGCLPPNIAQQQKLELNNVTFSLQVESVVDVSQPFYGQLQKVRGTENENVNVTATQPTKFQQWEPKAGRMLMLHMTDGVQEVQGMEYQPIRCLNSNLTPGTKIQIRGSVLCRRGVMFLRDSNVTVLGGDVEALAGANTPDAVLQNRLEANKNLSDVHYQQQKKQFSPSRVQSRTNGNLCESKTSAVRPTSSTRVITSSTPIHHSAPSNNQQHRNSSVPLEPIPPEFDESSMDIPDEDLMEHIDFNDHWDEDDLDIEEMMDDAVTDAEMQSLPDSGITTQNSANSTTQHTNPKPNQNTTHSQKDLCTQNTQGTQNTTADISHLLSGPSQNTPIGQRNVISQQQQTNSQRSGSNHSIMSLGSNSTKTGPTGRNSASNYNNITLKSHVAFSSRSENSTSSEIEPRRPLREIEIEPIAPKVPKRPVVVDMFTEPFTYLSILNQRYKEDRTIQVKVKAYVATMLSKLNNNDGTGWSLTVKINDGTAAVDVEISNQVLTKLIGFSAAESLKLKELSKTDKTAKRKLKEGVISCQQALTDLSCIMQLEVNAKSPIHTLQQLLPLNPTHLTQLQERNK